MKVLLIPAPPPEGEGVANGVDRYIRILTGGMRDKAEYLYAEDPNFVRVKPGKYKPIIIPSGKGNPLKKFFPYWLRLIMGYVRETRRLIPVIKQYRNKVDVIHVNRIGCEIQTLAAKLAGFKTIVATIHNLPGEDKFSEHWVRRMVEWISFACTDTAIAVSEIVAKMWHERVKLSKNKTIVIYNGMPEPDLSDFDRDLFRKSLCRDPGALIFGIAAQLEFRKGVMVAVEAFAQLLKVKENSYLLIAGTGREEGRLRSRAIELGIIDRVIFLGYRTDIYKIIASLDIHILPSISLDALSYSMVEAMYVGVPSIVTDVGGPQEVMSASGGGRVVSRDNVSAIYEAMKFYAENRDTMIADGRAAKEYAQKHLTGRCMVESTFRLYENSACKQRAGACSPRSRSLDR